MDFNDTTQEAEFRKEVADWLAPMLNLKMVQKTLYQR